MTLWLVTSRQCNLACSYCYQGSHVKVPDGLTRMMPDEVWQRGMEWAVGWPHAKAPLSAVLYGGEPLLAWEQIERWLPRWNVHFAQHGRTIRWSCTTNGALLKAEQRAFFDLYDVGLLLSLDGPPRLHDRTRVRYDGRGSWSLIRPEEILAWRPSLEIAWQLDPAQDFRPEDVDWLVERGFHKLNFNLNWLTDWSPDAQQRLTVFMRHVGRRAMRGEIQTNWMKKLTRAMTVDAKMAQPCGTGLGMLALTPEGDLFPSQEMAFTVYEPGKAPGTASYYRVGNVRRQPALDLAAVRRVSGIRTEQMVLPRDPISGYQYDCENCIAKSDSIGGCHCRYVGQNGIDPSYRFDVPLGYCQSTVAAMTGLLQAASIERWVRPVDWMEQRQGRKSA